jgi:hypothetical protein
LDWISFQDKESQAPSPNKLGKITPQKQRIASTVPNQTWSESSSKTKGRTQRPQTNLEGVLLKNKESHHPITNLKWIFFQNKESQAPTPNKLGVSFLQKQRIASPVPKQTMSESSSKTEERKQRPQTNWQVVLRKHKESQAPSPNKLGVNLLLKQRITSAVPIQIGKEYSSKTKHRPHMYRDASYSILIGKWIQSYDLTIDKDRNPIQFYQEIKESQLICNNTWMWLVSWKWRDPCELLIGTKQTNDLLVGNESYQIQNQICNRNGLESFNRPNV